MAAAFALGASGVVLGTRLNATYESVYPEAKKQALVKAGSSASCNPSTIRTSLYDELSGLPWPATIDGQCLRNDLTTEYSRQTPLQVIFTCEGILPIFAPQMHSNTGLRLVRYCNHLLFGGLHQAGMAFSACRSGTIRCLTQACMCRML